MVDLHRKGWRVFASPLVGFLLLFLGFPILIDLVYSLSHVSFTNLRSPEIVGFGNYSEVLGDAQFWRASWFSLRFGLITAILECVLGLGLAVFLSASHRKALLAHGAPDVATDGGARDDRADVPARAA